MYQGSTLTFAIPNIFRTLEYDLVVRHAHTEGFPNQWETATYELISLDGPPGEVCGGTDPIEGSGDAVVIPSIDAVVIPSNETHTVTTAQFSMASDAIHTAISPSMCLEKGKRYEIKFTFDQYDPANPDPTPKPTINIDSVSFTYQIQKPPFYRIMIKIIEKYQ